MQLRVKIIRIWKTRTNYKIHDYLFPLTDFEIQIGIKFRAIFQRTLYWGSLQCGTYSCGFKVRRNSSPCMQTRNIEYFTGVPNADPASWAAKSFLCILITQVQKCDVQSVEKFASRREMIWIHRKCVMNILKKKLLNFLFVFISFSHYLGTTDNAQSNRNRVQIQLIQYIDNKCLSCISFCCEINIFWKKTDYFE